MDWNILGHEWAAHILQQQIIRGEMRQAYLVTGMPGVGRRTLALRFAQAMNCPETKTHGQSCGLCKTCQRIENMMHPDLSVVQAESEGATLKVEQIRQLQHTLSLTPYEARWRVALLLRFEEANANAQNALLKTLEEAPPSVVLLLTATSAESLLPTIVSRCEQLLLRPLPVKQLALALEKNWKVSQPDALRLAHISQGRVGVALRLKESPDLLQGQANLVEDFIRMLSSPRRVRFAYAEQAVRPLRQGKDKSSLRILLQVWLSCWRDLFISASGADIPVVNLDFQQKISQLAHKISLDTARLRMADAERAMTMLDSTNANPQMLLESMLLDFPFLS
jgi:DNA polymerase III subunit delta'